MALDRFQNLSPERQREILTIAAEAFAEKGYDGTSYNDLLARLGMGKSQAYYYFADKADLFVTASAACYEEYYRNAAQLSAPSSVEGFWQHVFELHLLGFRFQKEHPIAARLTVAVRDSAARRVLTARIITGEGTSEQQYQAWIRLGQQLGAVRSDVPEEVLVQLCMHQSTIVDAWFAERAADCSDREMKEWSARFTDLSRGMLSPSRARPRKGATGCRG